MPTVPPKPNPTSSEGGEDLFSVELDSEIKRLQARLVDLDARRRDLLESEQQRRADRAAARESDAPGISE